MKFGISIKGISTIFTPFILSSIAILLGTITNGNCEEGRHGYFAMRRQRRQTNKCDLAESRKARNQSYNELQVRQQ